MISRGSIHSPGHKYHGHNVLVHEQNPSDTHRTVYFTKGHIVSDVVPASIIFARWSNL